MILHRKTSKKFITALLIFGLLSSVMIPSVVESQSLDGIKVMLLNGKSDNENLVTLSSPDGMTISSNDSLPFIYSSVANEKVSIQYDRYSLFLLETTNIVEVNNIIEKIVNIKDKNFRPNIEVINKNNIDYYRVTVGGFETIVDLCAAQQIITNEAKIISRSMGNLHWSLGTFININDANAKIVEINSKGFNSYLVQALNNGVWEYQVWVGDSASSAEHQQLKQSLEQQFLGIILQEPISSSYVIYKENASISSNITKNRLLVFSKGTLIKLSPTTENSSIQLDERKYQGNSLKYRGELSAQIYNGELAFVNVLPLDMYLYSVVGSEMYSSWPLEALKAQAVAARTFAYQKILAPRNSIANIYDTTADQAYFGIDKETNSVRLAVDGTVGKVLTFNDSPITAFYSSNDGGISSHGSEVWGSNVPYTSVKSSVWDEEAQTNYKNWYYILLTNGNTGYVRYDYIDLTIKQNEYGLRYGFLNDDNVNLRSGPSTSSFEIITTLTKGEEVVILKNVKENNPYTWTAGPFSANLITQNVNQYQLESVRDYTDPILDLKIAQIGPSGRVTLLADGTTPIPVKYADYYRTLLGGASVGVQSTLFEIEQTGRIEILAARGIQQSVVNKQNEIYVQSANGKYVLSTANNNQEEYIVLGTENNLRVATKEQSYILYGQGYGHGIGMSQWGAKGMADAGYTYQQILEYYYDNIVIKQIY
ncbi:MAG: SpoIID/LytB domain-containing protein [Vulcanibacillus sp.]